MWSRCSSSFCPPSPRPTVRDDPLRRWPSRTESRSDFNILRSSNGPMVTQRRQTQPWSSRARNDRVSTSPYLRCPAPSNRIATGTRTDSGEERLFLPTSVHPVGREPVKRFRRAVTCLAICSGVSRPWGFLQLGRVGRGWRGEVGTVERRARSQAGHGEEDRIPRSHGDQSFERGARPHF